MYRYLFAILVVHAVTFTAAFGQTQALTPSQLKKIKAATVFVKVNFDDFGCTGSGFVVHATKDSGLIITNEHVISQPVDDRTGRVTTWAKPKIEIVFNSGSKDSEWSAFAEVLYRNAADDLAVLKVKAIKPIPEPLSIGGADEFPETTPVHVCGFPFGEGLANGDKNPEISIGGATVSSNRTDDKGEMAAVQLNGALNPGNSGGPVVTHEGKLVGVAVSTVRGAGIGFAVPTVKVRRALYDIHFLPPVSSWVNDSPRKIHLAVKYADVLGKMKKLTVYIAPVTDAKKTVDDISKLNKSRLVIHKMNKDESFVELEFAVPEFPYFWLQYAWTDADGKTNRSAPLKMSSEYEAFQPRVESEPSPPPESPKPITDPGFKGLRGPDGKELPPVATMICAIPQGQISVEELNDNVQNHIGRALTVDILTTGGGNSYDDGPSLFGYNRFKATPGNLDFVVDAELNAKMDAKQFAGKHVAVRLTGRVKQPARGVSWKLFEVDAIGFIGLDGRVVATYNRKGQNAPPKAIPENQTPPQPVLKELPIENYPMGSVGAQNESYLSFIRIPAQVINKNFAFSVVCYGTSHATFQWEGKEIRLMRLEVKAPDSLAPMSNIAFYVKPETCTMLSVHLSQQPNHHLPCVFEFQPMRIDAKRANEQVVECLVTTIRFRDIYKPENRIAAKVDWMDLGDSAQKLLGIQPLKNSSSPSIGTVKEESNVLSSVVVVCVLAFVIGGLVWANYKYGSSAAKAKSKAQRRTSSRNREEYENDDDEDTRPRKSRRRD